MMKLLTCNFFPKCYDNEYIDSKVLIMIHNAYSSKPFMMLHQKLFSPHDVSWIVLHINPHKRLPTKLI